MCFAVYGHLAPSMAIKHSKECFVMILVEITIGYVCVFL